MQQLARSSSLTPLGAHLQSGGVYKHMRLRVLGLYVMYVWACHNHAEGAELHLPSCRPDAAVSDGPRSIGGGGESTAEQSDLHSPCAARGSQAFFITGNFCSHKTATACTCFVLTLARHLQTSTCF